MERYDKLFIGGDLSGIQKYLYNISSHKAAVSLKGRSAYLSDVMEDICDDIKETAVKAGALKAESIYCSGGKFYVTVEATDNMVAIMGALDKRIKAIKEAMWNEQLGQLGINIGYVAFSENADGSVNVEGQDYVNCGELWRIVNALFFIQKNQKFRDILAEQYNCFFEPIPLEGHPRVCAVTGIESAACTPLYNDKPIDGNDNFYVLPIVKEQIERGKELCAADGFKDFGSYATGTELGILRMDVDGLGKRFIKGFASIEDYRSYSDCLTDFFEKGIKDLQKRDEFKPHLNIVYAGGDDLFIVGRWDKVIDFAELIHKETEKAPFNHNVADNDRVHISGGIAVVKSTFPIAKAAELAGEAEEYAKQFGNGEKNAFHMLGKTVSWARPVPGTRLAEFDYVKGYKDKFVKLVTQYALSKSLLHKIMLYSSMADENKMKKNEDARNYSYIWHLSYYLTRFAKRYESSIKICELCYDLRDNELKDGRKLELIALAARWAELILKDELNNN